MLSPLQSPSISPSSSPTTSITQEALPVSLSNPSSSPSSSSSCSDPQPKPRRNYIQRKKCLNNSVNQIVNVLNFIQILQKDSVSPIEKQKVAYAHAQKIEAACWSPHSKLTPESYEKLISAKTAELCRVILKKSIPQMDSNKIQQLKQQIFSKNPTALTLNAAQLESNTLNLNPNTKSNKVKNGQGQMSNSAFDQTLLPEFPNSKTVTRTGPLTIDASNNVSLTIFDSSSPNLLSSESYPNIMLNNTYSTPVFPEINTNRISITPLKEMVPNLSSYLSIEKSDQTPSLNVLSEFEPMDQKVPFDDSNQDFTIDQLLKSNDMFQPWAQKEQDLFSSC